MVPSDELRKSYAHQPEHWQEFREKYLMEMSDPAKKATLARLSRLEKEGTVTLVYAALDEERNNATVLKGYLENLAKSYNLESQP